LAKKHQTRLLSLLLLASLGIAACSDSPTEPDVGAGPERPTPAIPTPTPRPAAFAITVRYLAPATPRQQQAVTAAVARWESVITRDLSDVTLNVAAATCFDTQPAINERIDDLLLFVEFVEIDGPGKVLGEAGPCYVRSENMLPIVGHLKLDAADLASMETHGTMDDVVLHEIGHVLGIGTLWQDRNLLVGSGGVDPQFIGPNAVQAYQTMGGTQSTVPVENTGAAGTRDGHWRESVFGTELMTGWISRGGNPMSALTIASLQDLGYGADQSVATAYTLTRMLASREAGSLSSDSPRIDLHGRERIRRPRFKVDHRGRVSNRMRESADGSPLPQ